MMEESGKVMSKAEVKLRKKAENLSWRSQLSSSCSGDWDANPRHTLYYKKQLSFLESEWACFTRSLGTPLPVVFRLGSNCPNILAKTVSRVCRTKFGKLEGRFVELNGVIVKDNIVSEIPYFLPILPTWQCICDSSTLKNLPALSSISDFLIREVGLGHIVRQELASMIPALLLDVQSQHRVLDCCAAPGSKTEQLLGLMRRHGNYPLSTGMVVANDADPVRINTLKERYDCTQNPSLLLTCAKAEDLASHLLQCKDESLLFDRVIADVPCSGDGTIRKFPHIYRLFRSRRSLDLHMVQLQIAQASLRMLKKGGRLVYSTCSINPLEDEAVVCGLLRAHGRQRLRLVDTRAEGLLPSLRSRQGLSTWLTDRETFLSGEAEEDLHESMKRLPSVQPSMLPPTVAERSWMHLERCHRVLPHDMDCGGFFVAVLELIGTGAERSPADGDNEGGLGDTVGGKEGQIDSTHIMKQLGYNPRRNKEGRGQGKKRGKGEGAESGTVAPTCTLEWAELPEGDEEARRLGLDLLLNSDLLSEDSPRLVRERCNAAPRTSEKKMRKRSKALFGSSAEGGGHATGGDAGGPPVREELVLQSFEVSKAVLSWGRKETLRRSNVTILKAGAHLTTGGARLHDGASASLAVALSTAVKERGCIGGSHAPPLVTMDLCSFRKVVEFGLLEGIGCSTELCEAVPPLKQWFKGADKTTKCLLVTLNEDSISIDAATASYPSGGGASDPPEQKRRLSKAERKRGKGKFALSHSSIPAATATAPSIVTEEEKKIEETGARAPAVLVLEKTHGEGGLGLRMLSPRSKCESYKMLWK